MCAQHEWAGMGKGPEAWGSDRCGIPWRKEVAAGSNCARVGGLAKSLQQCNSKSMLVAPTGG